MEMTRQPGPDGKGPVLELVRAGGVPEGGVRLLAESRQMRAKDSRELWQCMPFAMMCETLFGKKEGYLQIRRQFEQVKVRDYERLIRGACRGAAGESRELAFFLAACVDTLEFTSEEIYEHYRYLADLIQATVRTLADECWKKGGIEKTEPETSKMFGASVRKSCRLGALLPEKYEDYLSALLKRGEEGSSQENG